MTKQEFFNLLSKYEAGNCSKQEEKLLFYYYEQFQSNDIISGWSDEEIEQSRVSILRKINTTINKEVPKINWKKRLAVAASIIGFIGLTGLFYKIHFSQNNIPTDAITLKLQDGSIQVIEPNEATKLFDVDGQLIGEATANSLFYKPIDNAQELVYNTINVPYGKNFKLGLSDGTVVNINSGSEIKFPIQFVKGLNRAVFVTGEAYFEVAKNKKQPFIVTAENLNIRVLGTKFNVHAYPEDETSEVVLVEGSVALYDKNTKYNAAKATLLKPEFQAKLSKKTNQIEIVDVLTDVYTAWMDGELVFRNMSFENIAKKLERHYNVEIQIENNELAKQSFNASFGKEPLSKVLESLKENYGINYKQQNNKITIN